MRFWDSSAVVPLLVDQDATAAILALAKADPGVIAWWATEIECVSAIARLEREGDLSADQAQASLGRLGSIAKAWTVVAPTDPVRRTARRLLQVHPLRAVDALQLAAAVIAAEGRPESLDLVTLDHRVADAARREGFTVVGDDPGVA